MIDLRKIYFHSGYAIDKNIGTFPGSFAAPGALGVVNTSTITFPTFIPESTFFQGIYSVNGSDDWYRFGEPFGPSPLNAQLEIFGCSNAGFFTVTARNNTFDASSLFSVRYAVALIAKPEQGDITPQPIGADVIFNSNENYLKIISDTSEEVVLGIGASYSHAFVDSLGYPNQVLAYFETDAAYSPLPAGMYELNTVMKLMLTDNVTNTSGTASTSSGLSITDDAVVLSIKAGSKAFGGRAHVRVYGDD